jgi:hypothetical protein
MHTDFMFEIVRGWKMKVGRVLKVLDYDREKRQQDNMSNRGKKDKEIVANVSTTLLKCTAERAAGSLLHDRTLSFMRTGLAGFVRFASEQRTK